VGTQYRSAIFYTSPAQQTEAQAVVAELNAAGLWASPIVTRVAPLEAFYPAEDYHQEYFAHHPGQGYCQMVIQPKVVKFRQKYQKFLKI
jgi:peptide-methionine (S)-S-oxide reductase